MAILRSRNQQGNVVKVANPAVDRSILAWEQRITDAEQQAYERAKEELREEYEGRLHEAEQAMAAADQRIADGIAEAEQSMNQRWQQSIHSLARCADEIATLRAETLRASEGECVQLALVLAGKLLHRQLQDDEHTWLVDALRAGLDELPARHHISIAVHPEVAEVIEDHLDAALSLMDEAPSRPSIQPDAAMRPGSCRIECQGTIVDVGLQGAWERVAHHLLRQAPEQDLTQTIDGDSVGLSGDIDGQEQP